MAYQSTICTIDGLLQQSCDPKGGQDYWNIDDILAEEELVPCQFKVEARGLAYLDQIESGLKGNTHKKNGQQQSRVQQRSGTLAANSKVDVPLWLAIALAQREIIELKNPKYLGQKYFNTL